MVAASSRIAVIVGVGTTRICKAGSGESFPVMAAQAGRAALADAGLNYTDVEQAVVSYCYGDPTCGQRAVYELGLTGIPVINCNNNCSSASTALFLARQAVQAGRQCVLALGFEKMEPGLSQVHFERGWTSPTEKHFEAMYTMDMASDIAGVSRDKCNAKYNEFTDNVIKLFGYAAREHKKKYGTTDKQFAQIAYKNHRQSKLNPEALFKQEFALSAIEGSPMLCDPITAMQACSTSDGAAAVIVCSEEFARSRGLERNAVEIVSQAMVTDMPSSFKSYIALSGFDMSKKAADMVLAEGGVRASDVDVIECHDCFSINELFMYEALGLARIGEGGALIETAKWVSNRAGGENCVLGGRWVVNPSGGLESKGHPIGATGLIQCAELCRQLRGVAGQRQVDNARVALQHNFGIGGAAVVSLYRKRWPAESRL